MYGPLAELGIETGAGFGVDVDVAKTIDVLDGGNAKRERTARAERDEAIAMRDAALAQVELAKLQAAGGGGLAVQAGSVGGLGGMLGKLKETSPIGLPWWAVVVAVGGVAWAVSR